MNVPSYSSDDAPVPVGTVIIERSTTPLELGPKFNRTAADVVRFMMQQGEMVTATPVSYTHLTLPTIYSV